MSKLYELSYRTNINTYTFRDKHIILYDDHRTLLNILFEAKKLGEFTETPNLIYFDLHDDACELLPKSQLLARMGVNDLSEATSKQFWSFVEFDLGVLDDDWLLRTAEQLTAGRQVTLACPEVERARLAAALNTLVTNPVESGYLRAYARLQGIRQNQSTIEADIELVEAVQ